MAILSTANVNFKPILEGSAYAQSKKYFLFFARENDHQREKV